MLVIKDITVQYGAITALRDVSLNVEAHEIVTVIGSNGAGKSTLLNAVSGIVSISKGAILLDNRELNGLSSHRLVSLGLGYVPEGRELFGPMSVLDNLILGAYTLYKRGKKSAVDGELEHVFDLFPRLKERSHQIAGTLSGGEQQMLAFGRSLMGRPDFIMLDEPSMGLAPLIVRDILKVAITLKDRGKTLLLVEQNAKAALHIADRGYVMETGHLILEGTAQELLENQDVQRAYLGKDYRRINE